MAFKIITYRGWKRFWGKENTWLQNLFQSVNKKIDDIVIPDPDLSAVAKERNATANKEEILTAIGSIPTTPIPTDYAKQGMDPNATLTAVLEALTGGDDPSPDIPEGVAERLAMILEHFGIKTISGYSFGTPTEIIDELKDIMGAIDQEATLPNSVTIDGTTYSGTSNS